MYQDPKLLETIKRMEVEALLSLDKPSLEALSYLLRHKGLWPKGFSWNYNKCETCAMGLASQLWGVHIRLAHTHLAVEDISELMKMPYEKAADIFYGGGDWMDQVKRQFEDVTPEMVADQIDLYLGKQPL